MEAVLRTTTRPMSMQSRATSLPLGPMLNLLRILRHTRRCLAPGQSRQRLPIDWSLSEKQIAAPVLKGFNSLRFVVHPVRRTLLADRALTMPQGSACGPWAPTRNGQTLRTLGNDGD
jgi:hypothetical protein